ncbi:O-antigen ligase family protein [Micromonospora avicenniae]|uniref:O-antigen ligase family protein n=1 Tax=Micromonospora avicenniae TaxID=1198245 RepID=UPI0033196C1E
MASAYLSVNHSLIGWSSAMPSALVTPAARRFVGPVNPPVGTVGKKSVSISNRLPGVLLLCAAAFMAAWSQNHPILCAGLILGALLCSGRMPRLQAADLTALGLALWALATTSWSADSSVALAAALSYALAAVIFVTARHIVDRIPIAVAVAACYLLGALVRAWEVIRQAASGQIAARTSTLDLTVRFGVEGANLNFTAYTLVTGCLLAMLLTTVRKQRRVIRFLLLLPLPVLALGVLLNGTKGALVALVLIPAYLIASTFLPRLALAAAAIAVPVLLVLVPLGLGNATLLRFDTSFGQRSTGDASGRLLVWPDAIATWSESLFVGIGTGMYPVVNSLGIGAHNLLLTVGNDLGLVGVAGYAAVFLLALGTHARRHTQARRHVGLYIVTLFPIWLTGHWEVSLGAWLALGVLTATGVRDGTPSEVGGRHRLRSTLTRPGTSRSFGGDQRLTRGHDRIRRM